MSSETLSFDDDSQRIRTEASKKDASDPGGELRGLAVAFVAHEAADTRRFAATEQRWKQAAIVGGIVLSLAAWGAEQAWAAHADAAAGRAQIDDMHERVVRIEQQIDRLMERSDDR